MSYSFNPDQPLISVGIPTYNRPEGLRQTLGYITGQTYKNLEIIVSDNCSPGEETKKIVQKFIKEDSRIKAFRQEVNKGPVVNFNFVLRAASGKYFMWAADDDLWDKTYIEVLCKLLLKNKGAAIAMSNYKTVPRDKLLPEHSRARIFHIFSSNFNNNWSIYESLLNYLKTGNHVIIYGLYVTEVLKKIGGFHSDSRPFFHCSDYLTVLKMLLNGKVVFTNKILFNMIDSGICLTRFEILRNLKIDRLVLQKILRFCFFPVFYLYDLLYSIRYIIPSRFQPRQKVVIIVLAICFYVRNNINFICEVLRGIGCVFQGIFRKAGQSGGQYKIKIL